MDLSKYLSMFLAEAREHLQQLNLAVVRVEENPKDRDTVDEIFRIAHSFKGMSATMGFDAIAALTHQMEDVFELLRQRRGGLDRNAIDVLLECLDALEGAVAGIEEDGVERLEAEALIERLKKLVRPRKEGQQLVAPDVQEQRADVLPPALELDGRRVVRVTVTLREDALMPSVRAYQAIAGLGEHGDVLRSEPEADALEGFAGKTIKIWLAAEGTLDALNHAALSCPDVAAAEVRDEEPEAPAPASAAEARPTGAARNGGTVRVDSARLDVLMQLLGELTVHRTRAESLAAEAGIAELTEAMEALGSTSDALQATVVQLRMMPVEVVFLRFPRLVRDISSKLGKQVELTLTGQQTELDRSIVEALGDPLVHLVRNALDHGLEPPDAREQAGKAPVGTIEISARHGGGKVTITVTDDGRGIDPLQVARKAAERGLIEADDLERVDAHEAWRLLFEPGFSTVDVTSDLSGRGVGLDAVRTAVRRLGGEIVMTSEPGRGTTAEIRLPLTVALVSALLVEAGDVPLAVPFDRVERTVVLDEHPIHFADDRAMLVVDDETLPLLDAARAVGHEGRGNRSDGVVVGAGDDRAVLAVDRVIGRRELVTRPLPPELAGRAGVSGGAVLANGDIALIVDCDAVLRRAVAPAPLTTAA
jgi:two-component system chemotaxis sensor kinase CheA